MKKILFVVVSYFSLVVQAYEQPPVLEKNIKRCAGLPAHLQGKRSTTFKAAQEKEHQEERKAIILACAKKLKAAYACRAEQGEQRDRLEIINRERQEHTMLYSLFLLQKNELEFNQNLILYETAELKAFLQDYFNSIDTLVSNVLSSRHLEYPQELTNIIFTKSLLHNNFEEVFETTKQEEKDLQRLHRELQIYDLRRKESFGKKAVDPGVRSAATCVAKVVKHPEARSEDPLFAML